MESDERREIIKIYWQQYLLLEKRMIELSDYVAIDRKNYATFSNQFISMYLIICSEIDSVADEYCKRFLEQDKKNTFGITNKINLILHEYPKLQDWRCQTKFPYGEIDLVPFKKFKDNESSDWWKSYNSVKHNRTEKDESGIYHYQKANLKNILHALSALYLLNNMVQKDMGVNDILESNLFEIHFNQ